VLRCTRVRILIDYRPALVHRTGVGEYAHQLSAALLSQLQAGEELVLFSSSWKHRLEPDRIPGARVVDARVPVHALNFAWHRLEWPPVEWLAGRVDVAQSMHPLLMPARAALQAVTIHDLYFLDQPQGTAVEIQRDYPTLTEDHARRARVVVVVSQYTAEQVRRRLAIADDRIVVCSPGAPAWGPRDHLPANGPILFVGNDEPRKNLRTLLRAYARLLGQLPDAPELWMAGRLPDAQSEVLDLLRQPPLSGRARLLGYVADADREAVYKQASMLVMPSLDEGFGLPVLESMTAGVPVIAANRGALPEVLGDAGLLVDPLDEEALAGAMRRMLHDPGLACACVASGIQRAARFTWHASAARLLQAYRDATARLRTM
jgi:glycosyltransferase involved in cell wall biosynthesis